MLLNMCTNKTIEPFMEAFVQQGTSCVSIHISEHECDTPVLHMNFRKRNCYRCIWTYTDSVSESFYGAYTISRHTGVFRPLAIVLHCLATRTWKMNIKIRVMNGDDNWVWQGVAMVTKQQSQTTRNFRHAFTLAHLELAITEIRHKYSRFV